MEQQALPSLSILIPTWNRVLPVLEAVESVGRIMPGIEIIIVDNASEPALFEELKRQLDLRPGVSLFRNESNVGMVRNWNRCLEKAQGEWLGLLCSDDRYQPGAIDRVREIVRTRPEPALIIQDSTIDSDLVAAPAGSSTLQSLKLPIASGNFWHRRVYEQVGGFDDRFEYSADAEYWYRAALSFPVIKVREPFAVYVPHENNYMWDTWRRPDYLEQTELLAKTVAGYIHGDSPDRAALFAHQVSTSLWQTVLSIVACTFLTKGKFDILQHYLRVAFRQAKSPARIWQLLSVLFSTAVKRVWDALQKRGGSDLG